MNARELDRLQVEKEFDSICGTIRHVALSQWRGNPAARRNFYRIRTAEAYAQEVLTVAYFKFLKLAQRGISGAALATSIGYYACKWVNCGRAFGESGRQIDALDHALNPDDMLGGASKILDCESRGYRKHEVKDARRCLGQESKIDPPDSDLIGGKWQDYLTPCGRENPAELVALLLDLAHFIDNLTPRMREFAIALASGQPCKRIAARFDVAYAYVFQVRAKLDRIARELEL